MPFNIFWFEHIFNFLDPLIPLFNSGYPLWGFGDWDIISITHSRINENIFLIYILGVAHTDDTLYLSNNPNFPPSENTPSDRAMITIMSGLWASFVTQGWEYV